MLDKNRNVIGIRGQPVVAGDVDIGVVAKLEEILEEARRGEIIGFALVAVRPNHEIGTLSRWSDGQRHIMLAGAAYLMHDLCEAD